MRDPEWYFITRSIKKSHLATVRAELAFQSCMKRDQCIYPQTYSICVSPIYPKKRMKILDVNGYFQYLLFQVAPWRKRLGALLPPLGSRVLISVTPCGETVWVAFSIFLFSPHSITSPHSSNSFRFISFHPLLWWCVSRDRPVSLLAIDLQ